MEKANTINQYVNVLEMKYFKLFDYFVDRLSYKWK